MTNATRRFDYLQAGDETAFDSSSSSHTRIHLSKVAKTSATTITLENSMVFTRDGKQRKTPTCSYPVCRLWTLDSAKAHLAREEIVLTNKKAVRDLENALAGKRAMNGCTNLDAEQLAAVQALTAMLTK